MASPGQPPPGFDFTAEIRHVCADMVARLPELGHVELERVVISFSQARKRSCYGLHASLTPLRFEGGAATTVRDGQRFTSQKLRDGRGREMLYLLSFYLPRFLDVGLEEKLITILHELWHISPEFNGDLRRFAGRCHIHSRSQSHYDAAMRELAGRWMQRNPPPVYQWLQLNFVELERRYGRVYGLKVARPKLIPLP